MRADGRPHLTPIWFVWALDAMWLCTTSDAVKARIVAARPAVSFALEDGNRPVTGEGRATVVATADAPEAVHDGFRSKYQWDTSTDPGYVLLRIDVTRWMSPSTEVVAE